MKGQCEAVSGITEPAFQKSGGQNKNAARGRPPPYAAAPNRPFFQDNGVNN